MELENVTTPDNPTSQSQINQTGTGMLEPTTTPPVNAVDQAKEQGMELVHKAQDKAGDMVDEVQNQLKSRLNDEKTAAATCLSHLATAVQEAGNSLRAKEQAGLGGYADSTAKLVTNFSQYLQNTDIENFTSDLESVARRRPALFVGGLFVVGLVAGRFLKSSSHHGTATSI